MGVGFFQSEWIDLAKDGLIDFISNGGKMKLLTSAKVDEDDFEAFRIGYKAKTDSILEKMLIDQVRDNLHGTGREWTLNYLAWMIAEDILEVRILVHKTSQIHMYHEKISLWYDGSESVAFNGSLNATQNALENREVVSTFASWRTGQKPYIDNLEKVFDDDWNGLVDDYVLVTLPEMVKAEFKKIASQDNPHGGSSMIIEAPKTPIADRREYQQLAISALEKQKFRGILDMATGTGKTFTSLLAAKRAMEIYGPAFVLVVVPQTTLIKQWISSINAIFPNSSVLTCAYNKSDWMSELAKKRAMFSGKDSEFAITTYDSLTVQSFQSIVRRFNGNFIYIFDECHELATPTTIAKFSPNAKSMRIGLSATPERWFDKAGTEYLKKTIGEVAYTYSMQEAIGTGKLCEYDYHIVLTCLTDDEMNEFLSLTASIGRCIGNNDDERNEAINRLTQRRAKISKKAVNKWEKFFEVFEGIPDKAGSIVYVFDEQVETMVTEIKKRFGLNVHGIVASTSPEQREAILKGFNDGEIDVIVAIKCLDEGVDVPNCRAEYILSSSTNPREFIQRRGRVLRISKRYPNKIAQIYDFVTIGTDSPFYSGDQELAVIKRELPRVSEFKRLSRNKDDAELVSYLTKIGGLHEYIKDEPWLINAGEDVSVD